MPSQIFLHKQLLVRENNEHSSSPRSSALSSKLWMGNFDEKELAVI